MKRFSVMITYYIDADNIDEAKQSAWELLQSADFPADFPEVTAQEDEG